MTSDGIEGARPIGTWFDEVALSEEAERGYDVDKLVPRRVTFIGQPGAGKSELAGCCGERCDGTIEEEVLELPGFVGMIHGGKADLARRAKDIVRGRPVDGSLDSAQ